MRINVEYSTQHWIFPIITIGILVILGVLLYFGMERVWRREAAAAGTEEKAAESSAPMQDGAVSADTDGQENSRD